MLRIKHTVDTATHGGPLFLRVRTTDSSAQVVKYIDEGDDVCKIDCAAAGCTARQPTGQSCTCQVTGCTRAVDYAV